MVAPLPHALGKYRITAVLGEGAMGVVYKGFDPGIGRVVALKTIRRSLIEGSESAAGAIARFRNEAQAAGRLMHPGIVAVYDFGDEEDVAYIAMEFVEGSSLARFLAAAVPFSEDDVFSLMGQLLDALEHAHAKGVWHRDVKPANLLLTEEGRLKVADFGIARIESMALTQVTSIVGTPGYMAPEQFKGTGIDRRVDVYAAGVLLYQLLVGKPPFSGTPESLMYRVVHEPPVLPSAVPGCTRGGRWDDVLAAALAKDPAQRFASAAEFKRALVALAGRTPAEAVSGETLVTVRRRPAESVAAPPSTPSNVTDWDRAVLAQVEASLAKAIGPMASVMVRRTARDCPDLASLYARLAEQVTDPAARQAFVSQAQALKSGSSRPAGATMPPPTNTRAPLSDEAVARATKLLALRVGPIASVVAKRALAKSPTRDAFFAALEEAVTDPAARAALRGELDRLPK